ncbi:CapA family protein [Oscillospiraceae bacterium 38-13]
MRYLAGFLAALQLMTFVLAAGPVPAPAGLTDLTGLNDPLLWEPELPTFDGPVPRPGETPENFRIVLSFTGDMLLASLHGKRAAGNFLDYAASQKPDYFLQNVRPIFEADDFTVVNLENVLTDRNLTPKEKSTDPAYWFRSGSANTDILTSSGVEAVSLANNHTGDYGTRGYQDTVRAVSAAGLEYGGNDRTFYLEKNGYRIAVICHGLWNEGQASAIIRRIQAAEANSDFQVVFYHGGTEGVHIPEAWKVRASRRLIDNGADLVLGNHPHVLQPREIYKGREIIYSLGNFCFGGSRKPENRTIIYQLTLCIEDGRLTDEESAILPCYVYTGSVNNYCPDLIPEGDQRQRVLDFMDGKAALPY